MLISGNSLGSWGIFNLREDGFWGDNQLQGQAGVQRTGMGADTSFMVYEWMSQRRQWVSKAFHYDGSRKKQKSFKARFYRLFKDISGFQEWPVRNQQWQLWHRCSWAWRAQTQLTGILMVNEQLTGASSYILTKLLWIQRNIQLQLFFFLTQELIAEGSITIYVWGCADLGTDPATGSRSPGWCSHELLFLP